MGYAMSCIYDRHDYREEVQAPLCQLMQRNIVGEKTRKTTAQSMFGRPEINTLKTKQRGAC